MPDINKSSWNQHKTFTIIFHRLFASILMLNCHAYLSQFTAQIPELYLRSCFYHTFKIRCRIFRQSSADFRDHSWYFTAVSEYNPVFDCFNLSGSVCPFFPWHLIGYIFMIKFISQFFRQMNWIHILRVFYGSLHPDSFSIEMIPWQEWVWKILTKKCICARLFFCALTVILRWH